MHKLVPGIDEQGKAPPSHRVEFTRYAAGFTLLEVLITLAIAAVLMMIGLPAFGRFLQDSAIRSTSESVVNGLRIARIEAARRNAAVRFSIAGSGDASWRMVLVSDSSVIQEYSRQEGGATTVAAASPPGAVSVTFSGVGRILPAGATPNLAQIDINSNVDSDARPLRVLVDHVRGIRVCDPAPALAGLTPPDPRAC